MLLLLLGATQVFAQVKLTLTVDRTIVAVGESVNLTLTVSGSTNTDTPALPALQNLQVVAGPYTSTNYEMVNGRTSSSISYVYRLRAIKAGREQVGPAQVSVGGKPLTSNHVIVNVAASGSKTQAQGGRGESPDVFIRVTPDKTEVTQGEQITLTYRIYFAAQISQPEIAQLPTASGFWVEELTVPQNQALTDEVVNGRSYKVGVLRKVALFPTTTGGLTVEPLVIQTKVQRDARRRGRDPLDIFNDPFFSLGRQLEPMEVASPSTTLKVRALPSTDVPQGFNGAVGNYKIRAMLDKKAASTNDAVTLTVILEGTGNIKTLPEPVIAFPPDVDHYDPKTSEQIRRDQQKISGSKRFDYVIIPRAPGEQVIPTITYAFFDPNSDKYSTINTAPLALAVEKGTGSAGSGSSIPVATKRGVESIATDLAFIKTHPGKLDAVNRRPHQRWDFWLLAAVPWAAIAGVGLATRRSARIEDRRTTSRKAVKQARLVVARAEKSLKTGNLDATSQALTESLHLVLSATLEVETMALTESELKTRWSGRGYGIDLLERVQAILREADLVRFAPALADKTKVQQLIERTKAAISDVSNLRERVAV